MKAKIEILHLIDSGGLYGAENVIINLSIGLKRNNYRSVIGCFNYKDKPKPEIGLKAESMGIESVYFKLRSKIDLTCVKEIAGYCKKNQITVIHSHGYKPTMICSLIKIFYKIPYVITCHSWYVINYRHWLYTFPERIAMLFAENIIGVSEEIVRNLENAYIPCTKLGLINNGIDLNLFLEDETFDEIELRRKLGLRDKTFIIGSLGRLIEQKDYNTFLEVAGEILKEINNVEFIIAGEGHLKSELLALSKELGINDKFHFLGFRSNKVSILRLMNVFVLTSISEGLPIAMLEAMASRLPVVVTRVGEIPRVITNGENGILVESNNIPLLKGALISLINCGKKGDLLGKNAYDTVKKKYSIDQMTTKYLDIYNMIMLKSQIWRKV